MRRLEVMQGWRARNASWSCSRSRAASGVRVLGRREWWRTVSVDKAVRGGGKEVSKMGRGSGERSTCREADRT